jgi:hypothetical protein
MTKINIIILLKKKVNSLINILYCKSTKYTNKYEKNEEKNDNKINHIDVDKYTDTQSNINIIIYDSTHSIKQYSKNDVYYHLDYSISQKINDDDKIAIIRKYKFVQDDNVIKIDN